MNDREELKAVLGSLGYEATPAPKNQLHVIRCGLRVMTGCTFTIWSWLQITNQYQHEMFEASL